MLIKLLIRHLDAYLVNPDLPLKKQSNGVGRWARRVIRPFLKMALKELQRFTIHSSLRQQRTIQSNKFPPSTWITNHQLHIISTAVLFFV
jgi:hypothetical protein